MPTDPKELARRIADDIQLILDRLGAESVVASHLAFLIEALERAEADSRRLDWTQGPLPEDSPMMKAWRAYKERDEFENICKWAQHPEHVSGSLWDAFSAGFVVGLQHAVESVGGAATQEEPDES